MRTPKPISNEARQMATILMWTILTLILGSLAGVWLKLFWLDWVFMGCLR